MCRSTCPELQNLGWAQNYQSTTDSSLCVVLWWQRSAHLLPSQSNHVKRTVHEATRHDLLGVFCKHCIIHTVVGSHVLSREWKKHAWLFDLTRLSMLILRMGVRELFWSLPWSSHESSFGATSLEAWRGWIQTLLCHQAPGCWSFHASWPTGDIWMALPQYLWRGLTSCWSHNEWWFLKLTYLS